MTVKEAILKSLDEIGGLTNSNDVTSYIISKKYYDFKDTKIPSATVSAQLGDFLRLGDTRVKRIKMDGGIYGYYLTKNEQNIGLDVLSGATITTVVPRKLDKTALYSERDLHKLLCSYLKNTGIYSKTIFHEESKTGIDNNQTWTHPDMVGIQFLKLQTKESQNFLKAINQVDTVKLSSYELKREINSDSELKKAFFQAVSNSSWANFGYLVAFEFGDSLTEEIARLNQAFGIGVIELNSNPYQSKILFQPKYKDLDFKTIDKLCKMNEKFKHFIVHTEKLMTANEKYIAGAEKEFDEFCDDYFANDTEVENYCREKNIPTEREQLAAS
jgi:hypothetical protein